MKLSLFCKKVALQAALILIVFLILLKSLYPRYGVIVGVEYDYDDYIIEDGAGLIWVYEGVTDLSTGDGIAMLMWNKFTPNNIYDDVILDIA